LTATIRRGTGKYFKLNGASNCTEKLLFLTLNEATLRRPLAGMSRL
jgi:hypothetical protein